MLLLLRPKRRAQEPTRLLRERAWFAVRHLPERGDSRLPANTKGKNTGADSGGNHSWRLENSGHEALHDCRCIALKPPEPAKFRRSAQIAGGGLFRTSLQLNLERMRRFARHEGLLSDANLQMFRIDTMSRKI